MSKNIGERLRECRVEAGLSLRELAREANVSPSFLSQIENGKSQPSVATLFSLVTLLGAELNSFFGEMPHAVTPPVGRTPAPAVSGENLLVSEEFDYARPWANSVFANRVSIVHPDHRSRIDVGQGISWERLAATPESSVNFMLLNYAPGATSTPDGQPVVHPGYEYGYIIEGELEITVGDETFVIGANQSVGFDCTIPHVFHNPGKIPMKGVWLIHGPHDGAGH